MNNDHPAPAQSSLSQFVEGCSLVGSLCGRHYARCTINTTMPSAPSTPLCPVHQQHHYAQCTINTTMPGAPTTPLCPVHHQHHYARCTINTTMPGAPSTSSPSVAFVVGWRHAFRSEWPFININIPSTKQSKIKIESSTSATSSLLAFRKKQS